MAEVSDRTSSRAGRAIWPRAVACVVVALAGSPVLGCGGETVLPVPSRVTTYEDAGAQRPPLDAGLDGGRDAGIDSGFDAGIDSGFDAGVDAGSDAGADAGEDAGVCHPAVAYSPEFFVPYGPPLAEHATRLAIADFDGDGDSDVAASGAQDDLVGVYTNRGDGSFDAERTYAGGSWIESLAAADMDADGFPDLVVVDEYTPCGSQCCPVNCSGGVSILHNRGDGSFDAPRFFDSTAYAPTELVVGDLDGDARPDVVVLHSSVPAKAVAVLLNRGNGQLAPAVTYATDGIGPVDLRLADFDSDGALDVLVRANGADPAAFVTLRNDGHGGFGPSVGHVVLASDGVTHTAVGNFTVLDYDGDGRVDLAAPEAHGSGLVLLLGRGDFTFAAPLRLAVGLGQPWRGAVADLDSDGALDLLTCAYRPGAHPHSDFSLYFRLGDGHGGYGPAFEYEAVDCYELALAELNRDRRVDFVFGHSNTVGFIESRCR